MSVIRWLVVHEVCSHFEFARHFESHLAWPPPFYMHMRTRFPMNIPLLLCYSVHVLYSQSIRLSGVAGTIIIVINPRRTCVQRGLL